MNASTTQTASNSIITIAANPTITDPLNPNTRQDVYGNISITPERGSNFSFGVVYHPTPGLLATLDLVNIKIVGTRVSPLGNVIPKLLVGETGVTDTINNADLVKSICTTGNAGLFVPGATSVSTGNLPIVQLVDTTPGATLGNVVSACASGNTNAVNLNGITTANGTGGTIANHAYALLFSLPNFVNAGTTWTRQLDEHLEYTFPQQVFNGTFQAALDGTYLFFLNQDPSQFGGVSLGPPVKYKGTYSSVNANETAAPFRGTLSFTWKSGKNTIHTDTHWASSVADVSFAVPAAASTSNIGTNYNPIPSKTAGCSQAIDTLLAPDPRMTNKVSATVGLPGLGEEQINTACDVGNDTGQVIPGFITTDITYIRQLPGRTTLSFSVANIFDKDPAYQKLQPDYFAPYGTGNAIGRNIKVSLHKSF